MPRKPNYDFERKERQRLKDEKKARRAAEKKAAKEMESDRPGPSADSGGQLPAPSANE